MYINTIYVYKYLYIYVNYHVCLSVTIISLLHPHSHCKHLEGCPKDVAPLHQLRIHDGSLAETWSNWLTINVTMIVWYYNGKPYSDILNGKPI